MTQNDNISLQLKKFFSGLGLSQRDIANKLGVTQQVVAALLNGRPFGKKSAMAWSNAFGINPAWLITGEGKMLLLEKEAENSKEPTAINVVTELSDAIANEILKLVQNGELYPKNIVEQKEQLLKEKDMEIQTLNRVIGALQAQIEQLGAEPIKKVVVG